MPKNKKERRVQSVEADGKIAAVLAILFSEHHDI